jgi:hypothetical protein
MEKCPKLSLAGLTLVIPALISGNGPARAVEPPANLQNDGADIAAASAQSRLKSEVLVLPPDDELLIPEARALINQMGRNDQSREPIQRISQISQEGGHVTSPQNSKNKPNDHPVDGGYATSPQNSKLPKLQPHRVILPQNTRNPPVAASPSLPRKK